MDPALITTTIIIALFAGGAVWIYNRLVADRNQVKNAWSDIDVQLQRRHDLVGGDKGDTRSSLSSWLAKENDNFSWHVALSEPQPEVSLDPMLRGR